MSPADHTLGSLHVPVSDQEALSLSRALLDSGEGLLVEAQSVLVARGLLWLERGRQAKALYFFSQAQAHGRTTALLEDSFRRCVVAFCGHARGAGNSGGLWSRDGLAVDYRRISDIHSTTTRDYVSVLTATGYDFRMHDVDI